MSDDKFCDPPGLIFDLEEVDVNRDNVWTKISSVDLLPGDVISVPVDGGFHVPCDLVVVSGIKPKSF